MPGLNLNVGLSNSLPVAGVIDPDAYTAATYTTAWIDMAVFRAILAVIQVGTMATSSTVDAKIQQASDASGTGAKDVTGKAITQLTEAGTDSDKQVAIEVWEDELDIANDFTHVRLSVTVAAAASDMSAIVLGLGARYQPAADLATVDEIVSR
ncbi:MAG: hypothetical protein AB7E55_19825 [Pigmentiphaga sp.]